MKGRGPMSLIAANLVVLLGLAVAYPHLMVAPGALIGAHAQLNTECFACHAPWRGPTSERCIACHAVADIGIRLTTGATRTTDASIAPFHQALTGQQCIACHTDHSGPRLAEHAKARFAHDLLPDSVRAQCRTCHAAPADRRHAAFTSACATCHSAGRWTIERFDHSVLDSAQLADCAGCHTPPTNAMHRQLTGTCGTCHGQDRWTPTTFNHDEHFALDGEHNAPCATCHTGGAYGRYTCYGCHEHSPARIRAEHAEEGIRNIDNCVRCHSSAREREGHER